MSSFIGRFAKIGPVVMSISALIVCLVGWTGIVRDPPGDEGALAHIYQLLMIGQVPLIVAFLVVTAFHRRLSKDYGVVVGQLGLWIIALLTVPLLGL